MCVCLDFFQDAVHALHLFLQGFPAGLYFRIKSQDFTIHSQSVLDPLVNDGKNALDGRTVVHFLGLIIFNFLAHHRRIGILNALIETFTELFHAAVYGLK
jgi:hypothetical protein